MVTHYMLRTHDGKKVFSGKNILFVSALELIKSSNDRDFSYPCAPLDALPSNISIMDLDAAAE